MDEESKLKAELGLRPDEDYLCFSLMGGAGVIRCEDCGYEEEIISFTHGDMSCEIGRQCPHCHAFVVESNEGPAFHQFGEGAQDFICPECGTVIRKKGEDMLKGNDTPLVCPKCHSARLHYDMMFLT